MTAMLQDCPPVQAAYEEFNRFRADPVMQEKVRAREWFLDEQQLLLGGAYYEGREKRNIEVAQNFKRLGVPLEMIAEATGLSLAEIERLGQTEPDA